MTRRHRSIAMLAGVALATIVPVTAAAGGAENGCNGLYEVARFATFQQAGDTHGHQTVHHQFEAHGCGHHH